MWGHDPKVEKHRINLYNLTNLSTIPLQSLTKSQNKKKLILFLFTYSSMYVALKKKKNYFFFCPNCTLSIVLAAIMKSDKNTMIFLSLK